MLPSSIKQIDNKQSNKQNQIQNLILFLKIANKNSRKIIIVFNIKNHLYNWIRFIEEVIPTFKQKASNRRRQGYFNH